MTNDPAIQKALKHARIDLQAAKVICQNSLGEPHGINQTIAMIDGALALLTGGKQISANEMVIQIIKLTPAEQFDIAFKVAENIGCSISGMNMKHEAIIEILDFLNKIEGDGYGGMATFEIAREHMRRAYRSSLGKIAHPVKDAAPVSNGVRT